ncbi:peptidase domain-containing ABC transporter [Kyrpidia tusciae]|uniref:ABC transporter related protein n=1 Tax=Kyrpidia tusciae (strain DSM 2912 / NBRC 15312 / T2) TaxID=562970 RepID=D5WV08_KYRT2|nr:peptidase domain-containing ABC transporter [Kyrpidia tusciae]ADG07480.1 ABC transporter related protein [Kyrpidia tusciae DSM 2912]
MSAVRVPFVEQMEENECGLACLAMILGHHGHHVALPELRDRFGVARGGISFYHLDQIARQFGLKPRGYRVAPTHLGQLKRPAILHWEGKHFVVLEKIGRRHARIVDPAHGRMRLSADELAQKFTGYALIFERGADFRPRRRGSHWRYFASLALQHPGWLVGIVAVSLLLQGLGLAVPVLTRWMTDQVLVPGRIGAVGPVVYSVALLGLTYWLVSYVRAVAVARLQQAMDLSMMGQFMERLFRLPYGFFEKRKGGDLLFRANANVLIRQILSTRAVSLVIDTVLLVVYAVLMLIQSWAMGVAVILAGAALFALLVAGTGVSRRLTAREVTAQVQTQSYLSESLQSVLDIKVLGMEGDTVKGWRGLFDEQLRSTWRRQLWMALFDTVSSSLQYILPLGVLVIGAFKVAAGELTLGAVLGFSALATMFIVPIVSLSGTYNELLFLGSYLQRIYDVVASTPEQEIEGLGRRADEPRGEPRVRPVQAPVQSLARVRREGEEPEPAVPPLAAVPRAQVQATLPAVSPAAPAPPSVPVRSPAPPPAMTPAAMTPTPSPPPAEGAEPEGLLGIRGGRAEQGEGDGEAGALPHTLPRGAGRAQGRDVHPGTARNLCRAPLSGRVELEDVSFAYGAFSPPVIRDIRFAVRPGEKIGIVGASGAGKSTLVKLLLGLYKPTAGRILYDGVPLEEWDLSWLRSRIGTVLQESRLFQRTIAENIRMNRADRPEEDVVWAAEQAAIHDDILRLPLGYHTQVSESGGNFSGGQRQRLLLARALVIRPALLILDEATSFLDAMTERTVDERLSELRCTRIVIAHRLSTVENADRILVMDRGSIVEIGTHRELLEQRGLYHRLYAAREDHAAGRDGDFVSGRGIPERHDHREGMGK